MARLTQTGQLSDGLRPPVGDRHVSGATNAGSSSKSVKNLKKRKSQQPSGENPPPEGSGGLPRWLKSWVFWTFLLALVPGGIAFLATAMLLKLPSAPNCPSIFWPLASASVRLHCAQLAASKQNVKDLLQAIDLVKQLPNNHPLRAEIDRYLEEWSKDVLDLADKSFQEGKLDEAIKIARQIPNDVAAYKFVEERVNKWQSIWSEAEGIYKEAEGEMREQRWHSAFMLAAKLLRTDNRFWATTKYDQLNKLITTARDDGEKLAKAEGIAKNGNVDSFLQAIKLAESIQPSSYVYQKAQEAIPNFGRQMLDLAQKKLDKKDADEAISIAQQIPSSTKLQTEVEDFVTLAEAQRNAWIGTVSGLEAAIAQAQQVAPTRGIYNQAQSLIAQWQLEIEDVSRLEKARSLASNGTINELTAAIIEAQQIPANNPRATEARTEIGRWVAQIQTIEDRPYLDRAEQIALMGDVNSLQTAIAEAGQIRRGRALYRESRRKIATWTDSIQRIQDQPYLDQARSLASSGNYSQAIATAQQISNGRALSSEAQSEIDSWQGQIRGRDNWKRAQEVSLGGSAEALAEAIRLARRVPDSSPFRGDASSAMDRWSQQILDMAIAQGNSDISQAIETARLVPRGTSAYSSARQQIRTWRETLNPQPEPTAESTSSPTTSPTSETEP